MRTVLITGAANGLGRACAEAYALQENTQIIAIDHTPVQTAHRNVRSFQVDVADESSINSFAREIRDVPVDLVVHSAGIRGLVPHLEIEKHGDFSACESLEAMDLATLMRTFQINAAGTFLLLRAILPNVRMRQDAKVVIMSSRMGSISNNYAGNRAAGAAYAYRASKAALNAIIRSFAVDVPEVSFIIYHPGRVETKLVKWKEEGAISADEGVAALLPLIERWSKADSGKFYDRFGQELEW